MLYKICFFHFDLNQYFSSITYGYYGCFIRPKHTRTYIYTHTRAHIYIYTHTRTHIYTHARTYIQARSQGGVGGVVRPPPLGPET